jgi:hypothetical protein
VSSDIGLVALPFYATYAATKAGIAHSGEALRRELPVTNPPRTPAALHPVWVVCGAWSPVHVNRPVEAEEPTYGLSNRWLGAGGGDLQEPQTGQP